MPSMSEDEASLAIRALEHYSAYLIAVQRRDSRYQELADRLKRKQPESESAGPKAAKQRKVVACADIADSYSLLHAPHC